MCLLVHRHRPTEGYDLLSSSRDHVSLIFGLDAPGTQQHNMKASFHQIFTLDPSKLWNSNCINQHSVNLNSQITVTKTLCWTQKLASSFRNRCNLKNYTSECIRYFTEPNLRVYATSFNQTCVYLQNYWNIKLLINQVCTNQQDTEHLLPIYRALHRQ